MSTRTPPSSSLVTPLTAPGTPRSLRPSRAWMRRLRLINWHGHENATLDILGDMLAIIGENGSGKSLILDAIDWGLFPAPNKQFNAAAREGGRTSKRTLSNTILFFDPHGVDRADKGWRRQRTVGYCAVEVEHEGEGRWVYGSAAAATPHAAHPFYYALPGPLDAVAFLEQTPQGLAPLQMQDFRARNDALVNAGGAVFNATQAEDYNRLVARRLLNIEGADWQRRYEALYDVLHRMLGLKVDDALVSDPSGVVREFLPMVDRPHLERLVEGLEGIQRIHHDIDEYGKLRATLGGVVEARGKYHEAVLHHAALGWLRTAWQQEDMSQALTQATNALREAESAARQAESDEEAAYAEELAARQELEGVQQLHQGEVVQAVAHANELLAAAQHEQDRATRELRQAEERLQRAESSVAAARAALVTEETGARERLRELRLRAQRALGSLPASLEQAWAALNATPGDQSLADALHAAWTALDASLGALAPHARRIGETAEALRTARQAERDIRAQHDAATRATQAARQALWARWDMLMQRWPESLGRAPGGEPSTMALPPLLTSARDEVDRAHDAVREASARATRAEVALTETETRISRIEDEIAATQTEPLPSLSLDREHALALLRQADRGASPLYRTLDLAREGAPWADAIEGFLAHLDTLGLLVTTLPPERVRQVLSGVADWHLPSPGGNGKQGRNSLASVLVTQSPEVRRYLDAAFGTVSLTQDHPRSGDYLCPDGRYRLGEVTGTVALGKRSEALIGVVRRQAAAAARREELAHTRDEALRERERQRTTLAEARGAVGQAEERVRTLSSVAHMLDEVEQRRREMRSLRETEEGASSKLAAAGREVEEAMLEEEDARTRWTDATASYPVLADPAQLAPVRAALGQAISDTIARATETRGRLTQLQTRLRAAEDDTEAERESHGLARAQLSQVETKAREAQRMLNEARNALRAAGLENVEHRITQLQQRVKDAEGHARATGVAKGIALHQLEASRAQHTTATETATEVANALAERTQAFGALLTAVADSLDLPANQVDDPARYARQLTKGRESRARLDDDLPRAFSTAEREQDGFLVAVAEYQAMVGADDRFGLRAPAKQGMALAPQGWLLDVAPRLEGTSDIRLLLTFLDQNIEQLQQTLSQRVTRVVRDIILGEVVSHLVDQLTRAHAIIEGLNERLATARFFARNTCFSLRLAVRVTRHPDIPFDHVAVATALLEHGRAMPAGVQGQITTIFATWLDEQMRGQAQTSVEALVEQLDYRRWVDISLLHSDDLDPRVRPWDSAVAGFGSGGEQRVPVYVLLLTAAAMQFAVSNAPLRLLMHDEAFARMDQRNADLVVRFAQQLGMGLVIASPNLDLFAEGVTYATAYRLRQLPSGLIAREALHLRATPLEDDDADDEEGQDVGVPVGSPVTRPVDG